MFDLFYTLFKYKEKAQKDELGYYPEKVDVRAFPERRFLWTSRFLAIISCLSLCTSMILGSVLCLLIPLKNIELMSLQIDYQLHTISYMNTYKKRVYAGDLVAESLVTDYITKRYTIGDSFDEMQKRYNEGEFVAETNGPQVTIEFNNHERKYFEMMQKKGIRRKVVVERVYPVSFNFWQARFKTIDTAPDLSIEEFLEFMGVNLDSVVEMPEEGEPLISNWIATLRMTFGYAKYENNRVGLINPFGMTVHTYDISYLGNNIKTKRN